MRTGGFAGGEIGLAAFNEKGSLSFADPATVRARQRTKDVVLATTLLALTSGSAILLQQAGFVDLSWLDVSWVFAPGVEGGGVASGAGSSSAGVSGVSGAVDQIGSGAVSAIGRGAQAKVLQNAVLAVVAAGVGASALSKARSAASKVGPALVERSKRGAGALPPLTQQNVVEIIESTSSATQQTMW